MKMEKVYIMDAEMQEKSGMRITANYLIGADSYDDAVRFVYCMTNERPERDWKVLSVSGREEFIFNIRA